MAVPLDQGPRSRTPEEQINWVRMGLSIWIMKESMVPKGANGVVD
ncbi:hypothetical protein [Bacillus sp. SG-1]|nr:hypothetical protein [Bacillus sp. SG-1]EDL63713.1 hypothetical protein BSG1_17480 [Bacillus sp. SG-1]